MGARIRTTLAMIGALSFGGNLLADSNYDDSSWTDGPIRFSVDISGVSQTNGSAGGAVLLRAAVDAAQRWNAVLDLPLFEIVTGIPGTAGTGNQRNEISFSTKISDTQSFGTQFGFTALDQTGTSRLLEVDLIFNPIHRWLYYHGPLFHEANGDRIPDFYRVLLHEMGHSLGMSHPASDEQFTIMRSRMSDIDDLTPIDLRAAQKIRAVLIHRNRPRITQPRRAHFTTSRSDLTLGGTATPLFVSTLIVKIDFAAGSRRRTMHLKSRWSRSLSIQPGTNRLRFYYRPFKGAVVFFATKTITVRSP